MSFGANNPPVSVIVCTDGRPGPLAKLHAALAHQHYAPFEIVYVVGPSEDGAWEATEAWARAAGVKRARCGERNLSMARNIGLTLAAGELVAFIDDDAIPEPEWLAQLVGAFDAEAVAGASGAVFDPSGVDFQFRFSVADRYGASHHDIPAPFEDGAYPLSPLFPHVMGANCMFRRDALVALGGFDEEYDYYLDETDLCCRLIDAGRLIRQRADAPVHHKFLESRLRNAERILVAKYPVLKNKLYFTLINNRGHASMGEIIAATQAFFAAHRSDLARHVERGAIAEVALEEFDRDAERAWRTGLARGLSGQRRLRAPGDFAAPPAFAAVATRRRCEAPLTLAFLVGAGSQREPQVRAFAAALAALGHDVHVVLGGAAHDEVDLVDGVWLRWRSPRFVSPPPRARSLGVPEPLWRIYANVDDELRRMEEFRPFDVVEDASGQGLAIGAIWRGARNVAALIEAEGLRLPPALTADAAIAALCAAPLGQIERDIAEGAIGLITEDAAAREHCRARLGERIGARIDIRASNEGSAERYRPPRCAAARPSVTR